MHVIRYILNFHNLKQKLKKTHKWITNNHGYSIQTQQKNQLTP